MPADKDVHERVESTSSLFFFQLTSDWQVWPQGQTAGRAHMWWSLAVSLRSTMSHRWTLAVMPGSQSNFYETSIWALAKDQSNLPFTLRSNRPNCSSVNPSFCQRSLFVLLPSMAILLFTQVFYLCLLFRCCHYKYDENLNRKMLCK